MTKIIPTDNTRFSSRTILHQRGNTRFFREGVFEPTFSFLKGIISSSQNTVQILVVGCSTGEEVYSFAMALSNESLPGRVKLHGIDKDGDILIYAARGIYDPPLYENSIIPDFAVKYFNQQRYGDSTVYAIKRSIKESVSFQRADFAEKHLITKLNRKKDVIIMNFIWQHLDPIEKASAIQNVLEILNPGGFLITEARIEGYEGQLKLVAENKEIKQYVLLP